MMENAKESPIAFDRDDARQILLARGWLAERPEWLRGRILEAGRLSQFADGEALYRFGDPPNGIFGLVAGSVQIEIPGSLSEALTIHQAEPGFWIGDLALFSSSTRLVTVTARGEVRALFVPVDRLRAILRDRPESLEHFYAMSHANMATALRLLADASVGSANRRIALRLLHQDELTGSFGDWIRLSQDELAALAAVSVPTLQRAIRRMAEAGMIEVGYSRIRVLDRMALRDSAAS